MHCTAVTRPDEAGRLNNSRILKATAKGAHVFEIGAPGRRGDAGAGAVPSDIEMPRLHGLTPFTGTSLDRVLRNMGVDTVVAIGNSINIGVLGLVLSAVDLGYQVVVPRDAVAAVPAEYGEQVLANTIALLATIVSSDDLVDHLGRERLTHRFHPRSTDIARGSTAMTVTSFDDYPVHQSADWIANVGTSDRNFYDRYYFNALDTDGQFMAVFGLGQYPNLGTTDAFVTVRRGEQQHVVRGLAAARRPGRHAGRAAARRGPRAAQAAALRVRADRARRRRRPHLGGRSAPRSPSPTSSSATAPASRSTPSAWPRWARGAAPSSSPARS